MARDDQKRRKISGPRGLPGDEMGQHVATGRVACNCGGCRNGERITQKPKVIQIGARS